MATDINSFALNLELALQDSATEALRKISGSMTGVEEQAKTINAGFSKFSETARQTSTAIKQAFDNAAKSVRDFGAHQDSQMKNSAESIKFSQNEAKWVDQIAAKGIKSDKDRSKAETLYHKEVDKFQKKHMKDYKGETLNKKQLQKFDKEQLKGYQKIQKLRTALGRQDTVDEKAKKAAGKMSDEEVANKSTFGKVFQKAADSAKYLGTVVKGTVGILGSAFGEIAAATSVVGLFNAGVLQAADREEKFHTINFRQLGTMRELNKEMMELGTSGVRLTTEEFVEATIALRQFGATKPEIDELRNSVAAFDRVTGADVRTTARFAKVLKGSTHDSLFATKQMLKLTGAAEQFAFDGSDMNMILGQVTRATQLLGLGGSKNIAGYTDALIKSVAAAKRLGISTEEAAAAIHKMEDPLNTVAILGPESLNWDFKKRSQEMGAWAKNAIEDLKKAQAQGRGFEEQTVIAAMLGVDYTQVETQLNLLSGQVDKSLDMKEPLADTKKQVENQFADILKGAEGVARQADLLTSQVITNIQKALQPVMEMFSNFMNMFLSNPVYTAILAWAVIGVAAGGLLFTAFMGIVSVVGMLGAGVLALGSFFLSTLGTAATALISVGKVGIDMFKAMGEAAGGFLPLLGLMGEAAILIGTAYAGWKIGQWINNTLGLSDSIDRVNKGQGTWMDYLKYYSTAAGPISTFYKSYLDWSNKAADAKEREIRMNREEAKSHWVTEKLAMQEAFRKATVAGDKNQMNALDKQLQQMLVDEQKEYERSEQYKTTLTANAAKEKQDIQEKATTDAMKNNAMTMSMTEKATDGLSINNIADKLGINSENAAKIMAKIKEYLPGGDQLKDIFGNISNSVAGPLSKGMSFVKSTFDDLVAKFGDNKTFAPIMETLKGAYTQIKDFAAPIIDSGGAMIENAIKDYGPKVKEMLGGVLETGEQALNQLTSPNRPDTIVTVKTDDETARPQPRNDEQAAHIMTLTEIAKAQLDILRSIADKLDPETSRKIRELLERTLPELEMGSSSGLASSANQWRG